MNRDFREIAHCGGKITLITKDEGAQRLMSVRLQHAAPVPAAWFGVYVNVETVTVVGIAQLSGLSDAPPGNDRGLLPVFVGADSEGRFGHQCPQCRQYWRSGGFFMGTLTCPYCALRNSAHVFLSERQRVFIGRVVELANEANSALVPGERTIDLDAEADATEGKVELPKAFFGEKSMQTEFVCEECRTWNDVLGRFGCCCACGTRSELQDLQKKVGAIRERINREQEWADRVRDLVGAFDSIASQYVKEMLRRTPLVSARRTLLEGKPMHGLRSRREDIQTVFGIDICRGLKPAEVDFAVMMFERRHIYEHNGGEADEQYLAKSGDKSVQLKQLVRESHENAMRLADVVLKLARNLHDGFHEMFPPDRRAIEMERERRRLMRQPPQD